MTIEEVRAGFMDIVYAELSDDSDNCRANRIIDAADEYVEEVMRLERENDDVEYDEYSSQLEIENGHFVEYSDGTVEYVEG